MAPKLQSRRESREIGPLMLRASVKPSSIDDEARTVELTWTTGAAVLRRSWFDGDYYEELSLEAGHVRMGRLENGAPLLDSHIGWSLDGVLGVVESARIEGNEGIATVRFARGEDDEHAEAVWRKVRDGILRHVSVGYRVYRYEITEEEGKLPVHRATDWEPYELSIVPMGADDAATVRAAGGVETNPCEFVSRGAEEMKPKTTQGGTPAATPAPAPQPTSPEARGADPAPPVAALSEAEIRAQERERAEGIRRLATLEGLGDDFVREMDAMHDGRGASLEEARTIALERHFDARSAAPAEQIRSQTSVTGGEDLRRAAAADGLRNAILHRHNPGKHTLTDAGRMYRGLRVLDMARQYLEDNGHDCRGLSPNELASRALHLDGHRAGGGHSTSDFPFILADVATKELRDDYENSPRTFLEWTSTGTLPDFKEVKVNQLGDFPSLDPVIEGGEYQLGTIGEAREAVSVSKYGRRILFTWEMLIDDDLEAFMRLASRIGFATANLESDLVYNHLLANPAMGDGNNLFDSVNHGNVTAGALDTANAIANVGAMRAALRKQTGIDGRKINLTLRTLIVPAELETAADQLLTSITPNQNTQANPFANGRFPLTAVAEPRLDDQSLVEFYGAGDPNMVETIRVSRLRGEDGPMTTQRVGFEVDGVEIKVRHVVGVKAIDWRNLVQSNGVDA